MTAAAIIRAVVVASTDASGVPEHLVDELAARNVVALLDVEHRQEVDDAA